ncbi:MAG: hypothetical protein HY903_02040 [Deltaproteobacteria bacterium]|nr:hypothetical protein [Deltaproteobacteria bacterium]
MGQISRRTSFLALLSVTGCGTSPGESGGGGPPVYDADVSGTWLLSGRGSRTGCADKVLDGDFSLDGMVPLQVRQAPQAGLPDTLSLVETVDVPPGTTFSFHGTVSGAAVRFNTVEQGTGYRLLFSFSGEASAAFVSGTFTGDGPEDCSATGTFEVVITGQAATDGAAGGDPGADPAPAEPAVADPGKDGAGDARTGDGVGVRVGDFEDRLGLSCHCRGTPWVSPLAVALSLGLCRRRRAVASRPDSR